MTTTLAKAEPTQADVMAAKSIGEHHPYWAAVLRNTYDSLNGAVDSEYGRQYRELLEVVVCRERQLGQAIALLTERDRTRIGV